MFLFLFTIDSLYIFEFNFLFFTLTIRTYPLFFFNRFSILRFTYRFCLITTEIYFPYLLFYFLCLSSTLLLFCNSVFLSFRFLLKFYCRPLKSNEFPISRSFISLHLSLCINRALPENFLCNLKPTTTLSFSIPLLLFFS